MAKSIDPVWHKQQVGQYVVDQSMYRQYADWLRNVLTKACVLHAPTAMVQAREKTVASFAEKAARKFDKYRDPVHQLTDLCGARVIINTLEESKAICRFVRNEFRIDEANSDDAGARLKDDEFGYRSIHYIIQVRKPELLDGKPEVLGVPAPVDVVKNDCKAEIQVRTVAQHARAAITHDRLYKGGFTVPGRFRRLAHRAAALLEEADEALDAFESEMQSYLGSYTVYLTPDELQNEINVVDLVLEAENEKKTSEKKTSDKEESDKDMIPVIALRLARLYRAAGDPAKAIATLTQYDSQPGPLSVPILVELGSALVESGESAEGARWEELLRKAAGCAADHELTEDEIAQTTDRKLRATALAVLAGKAKGTSRGALYTRALQLDPRDPYILCSQLVYNLARTSQRTVLDSARPAILRAIETCRAHVGAGLQLPRAWLTMARLHLLLGRHVDALDEYSKAVRFYLAEGNPKWPQDDFDVELEILEQIQAASDDPRVEWAERLLKMGRCLKNDLPERAGKEVSPAVPIDEFKKAERILIVAGGTAGNVQQQMQPYVALVKAALDGFEGVVISGGTDVGIPGVVGRAAAELRLADHKHFTLVGYHPAFVQPGVRTSDAYDYPIPSGKEEREGLGEPLQIWMDLLAAGVKPSNVRVLGINGGDISRFECALALAMGALVGIVESSERSADLMLRDPDWSKCKNLWPKAATRLLPLPNDPMTAHAFTQVGESKLSPDELERMGKLVHETYRKMANPENKKPDHKKPNSLPWEVLPEHYQQSSREQAAYAFRALRSLGFQIEKVDGLVEPLADLERYEKYIDELAEKEHGRWNFERLQSGWRLAPDKDDDKKLSPHLKPWTELPDQIREYDRKAVAAFPRILAAGGYKLTLP